MGHPWNFHGENDLAFDSMEFLWRRGSGFCFMELPWNFHERRIWPLLYGISMDLTFALWNFHGFALSFPLAAAGMIPMDPSAPPGDAPGTKGDIPCALRCSSSHSHFPHSLKNVGMMTLCPNPSRVAPSPGSSCSKYGNFWPFLVIFCHFWVFLPHFWRL